MTYMSKSIVGFLFVTILAVRTLARSGGKGVGNGRTGQGISRALS